VSREIREAVPAGTVVTLSPLYALQAGLDIYPELSAGPFGYRVAWLMPAKERSEYHLMSPHDLVARMRTAPPEAILAGSEGMLETPLVEFAVEQGYRQIDMRNDLTLWVRPDR
jgi:hypothetical protein